tara:strand:+ start:99 stop:1067 length:969 start_codon:yes stop_codon:yes gene_type:complete
MKKLSLYIFLSFIFFNLVNSSELPPCKALMDFTKYKNCYGGYTDDKGLFYMGEFGDKVGERDGLGVSEVNTQKYLGEFKNNIPFGKGVISTIDGTFGQLHYGNMQGLPNGYGILKMVRKNHYDRYFGEFKNGNFHGEGAYIYSNGLVQKGIFEDGKLIENKSLKECDRNKPFQTYNNCQLVGGVLHSVDGSSYGDNPKNFKGFIFSGEFQNGKPNGYGLIIAQMPNDKKIEYMGQVKNGFRDGKGSLTWVEFGDEHIGNFKNELPHGEGVLIMYTDEEEKKRNFIRFGLWNNGKEHGKGFVFEESSYFFWYDEYVNGKQIKN